MKTAHQLLTVGIVLKRMKGFYYVEVGGTTYLCRIKGNLFENSAYEQKIAVGDRVEVDLNASEDAGLIYKILPRSSKLSRPMKEGGLEQVLVSNAEFLLIVAAIKNPVFRYGIVDRFLIAAQQGSLTPMIILNKIDLATAEDIDPIQKLYTSLGYEVLLTSVPQQIGLTALKNKMIHHVSVFAGHSGVGKSSLVQSLFPNWNIKIGQVNDKLGKGRHTTTLAEMHPIPEGGYLIDTPGIRELGLYQISQNELEHFFIEFEQPRHNCRFKQCTHRHEPNCGIKEALANRDILQQRYDSYCAIFDSIKKQTQ